jgi:hypothetical protein
MQGEGAKNENSAANKECREDKVRTGRIGEETANQGKTNVPTSKRRAER